jgi:hypothetical protein
MSHYIDKIRKARETNVEAAGFTFTVRRPTDMEVVDLRNKTLKQGDIMEQFVMGWAGVKEVDIIPGGTGIPVPFDTTLFMEWVADRPDLWAPLTDAILITYDNHQKRMGDMLGKPEAG